MQKFLKIFTVFSLACLSLPANELMELYQRAESGNPTIQAARERVEQSRLKHESLLEFLDPSVFAAAGATKDSRTLPFSSSSYRYMTDNTLEMQGGVLVPVADGAYVSAGGATRRYFDTDSDTGHFYQNLLGLQISVPLMRDRGFALYSWDREIAMAEYNYTAALLLSECQTLRHDLEIAYVNAYETLSSSNIQNAAVERFEQFLENARSLAELKSIPDYQIHAAVYELQIGRDDDAVAVNNHKLSLVTLASLIGDGVPIELKGNERYLIEVSEKLVLPDDGPSVEMAMSGRGDVTSVLEQMKQIRASLERLTEEGKDSLSLNAGVSFQAEGRDHPFQAHRIISDDYLGCEINLVWQRSLNNRGNEARQRQNEARLAELNAILDQQKLLVTTQMRQAELRIQSARQRLEFARQGIQAASDNVTAEQQRFQLGESSSQAVLDAQKNYNAILLRMNTAAADLLRAVADYRFACGYRYYPADLF